MAESKAFIEWVVPDLDIEPAARLVDIQRGVVRWHMEWPSVQNDAAQRTELAKQAQAWSDEILSMSGLLR